MKDFDAVVFDMDGVIFDSERAVFDCWRSLARRHGIEGIEGPYMECIGTNAAKTKEIMRAAYGAGFPYEEYAAEVSREYHAKYDGGRLPLKRGALNILEFLKKSGKKTALASSTRKETVIRQLEDAGLSHYFGAVVSGDMTAKSKPEPDIFLLACRRIGVRPERAFAIEDSYNGIRAASRGGLRPVMVPDLLPPTDEMRELSEAVFRSLDDVIKYFSECI